MELPPAAVLAGEPVLIVLQPVDLKQTIRRDTLSAALAAAGADDIDVPAEWDGVTLRGTIGRTVVARYLGPAGVGDVPTTSPSSRRRRSASTSRPGSRSIGSPKRSFAPAGSHGGRRERWAGVRGHPAWLLDVPDDGAVTVETMPLAGGTAIVIEEAADGRGAETPVFVSRPWRLYAVSSLSRETEPAGGGRPAVGG